MVPLFSTVKVGGKTVDIPQESSRQNPGPHFRLPALYAPAEFAAHFRVADGRRGGGKW